MSNSFRDAVRQVMLEGAKEKTSDGMTPDAKRFRHDLHKVQDAGYKHMVQKDSETKDYEKMFKPKIDKMPVRLSDVEPKQGLDKYVEYNEALKIAEAKKHAKGCTCQYCSDKEDKEDEKEAAMSDKQIAEVSVMPAAAGQAIAARVATKAADAKQTSAISAREPAAPAPKPVAAAGGGIGYGGGQMGSTPSAVKSQTQQTPAGAAAKPAAPSAPRTSEVVASKQAGTPDSRTSLRAPVKAPAGEGATGKALAGLGVSKADRLNPNFLKSKGITAKPGSKEANLRLNQIMQGEKDKVTAAENPKSAANAPTKAAMPTRPGQSTSGLKPGAGAGPGRAPTSMAGRTAAPPQGAGPGSVAPRTQAPPQGAGPGSVATRTAAPPKGAGPGSVAPAKPAGAGGGPGRAPTPPMKVAANPQASQAKGMAAQRGPTSPQGMSLAQYQTKQASKKPVPPTAGPGSATPAPQPSRQALQQSYEIEVNGQSYTISEAHAAAIAAYVEKYGITEKSDPNVGKFISKEMKHPEKLTAQGKKQKIKQAIAIYYSKKRHGEKP